MSPLGPRDEEEALKRAECVLFLRQKGIRDINVLRAVETVPRLLFVPPELADMAYANRALPIACGQTMTELFLVAYMTEQLALNDRHKVLEIGMGSGYQTAILARLARRVYTIDRYRTLVAAAEARLAIMKVANITSMVGDGTSGWPAQAPFDRILVTAAAETMPAKLIDQLREDGVMVLPVGPAGGTQELVRVEKTPTRVRETPLMPVRFVPLVPGRAISL